MYKELFTIQTKDHLAQAEMKENYIQYYLSECVYHKTKDKHGICKFSKDFT